MALTISGMSNIQPGISLAPVLTSQSIRYATITGDSSYPAGGYTVTTTVISLLGFTQKIYGTQPLYTAAGNYAIFYDQVYNTLRFVQIPGSLTTMTEAATSANLSAVTIQVAIAGM